MTYSNLWTTNHPVAGNNQAKDLDDAIRRVRVDLMERLLSVIGGGALATADPINPANATTAALKTAMDALAVTNVTASGLSADLMVKATGAVGIGRADTFQSLANNVAISANLGTYNADLSKMINVMLSSNFWAGTTINLTGSSTYDTMFWVALRAGGGTSFPTTITWGSKFVFATTAPVGAFASGKQILILFWYNKTVDKAFELTRTGLVSY